LKAVRATVCQNMEWCVELPHLEYCTLALSPAARSILLIDQMEVVILIINFFFITCLVFNVSLTVDSKIPCVHVVVTTL
jgi:hypothetical protein